MDTAYQKIGGFGTAQKLALVCLTVTRNSGLVFVYLFGLLTME